MAHLEGPERAQYVQDMFARIAGRYDLMNRLMTFGQDIRWRRCVIDQAQLPSNGRLLDIATGTGEIALEGLDQTPGLQAVGGDFAHQRAIVCYRQGVEPVVARNAIVDQGYQNVVAFAELTDDDVNHLVKHLSRLPAPSRLAI